MGLSPVIFCEFAPSPGGLDPAAFLGTPPCWTLLTFPRLVLNFGGVTNFFSMHSMHSTVLPMTTIHSCEIAETCILSQRFVLFIMSLIIHSQESPGQKGTTRGRGGGAW